MPLGDPPFRVSFEVGNELVDVLREPCFFLLDSFFRDSGVDFIVVLSLLLLFDGDVHVLLNELKIGDVR